MSAQLLSSKIVVVEEEPQVRGIPSAPTSVAGAVGITERGPIGEAVLCSSFEEFQSVFGGFTPDSDLALAAMGFFENGGSQLWVVRTAHYDDISDPKSVTAKHGTAELLVRTGAPQPASITSKPMEGLALVDGDTLEIAVNGAAPQVVTIEGEPAELVSSASFPTGFLGGETLRVETLVRERAGDLFQVFESTVTFDAADQTLDDVVSRFNAQLEHVTAIADGGQVRLISETIGYSARLQVLGGSANTILDFPADPAQGTGNVSALGTATLDELAALLWHGLLFASAEVTRDGRLRIHTHDAGQATFLQVMPSRLSAALGFDAEVHFGADEGLEPILAIESKDTGAYANRLQVEIRQPTNGRRGEFDMLVIEDGVYRETFPNLTLDPNAERYVERIANDPRSGSIYVRVWGYPVDGGLGPPLLSPQTLDLEGGSDGLDEIDDSDFIGSEAGKTGLHALDHVQDLSLLLVPGRATPAVHNAMVRYCEVDRNGMAFALLDSPADQSATGIVEYVTQTAALENFSEYAAIYWPRVKVLNPQRSVFGPDAEIVVPPSGIIAGVYARTDAAQPGGVYDPAAGIDKGRMFGVLGFETDEVLEERKRDLVYPHRINPLTTGPGLPRYIDGSRTLKGDGNFPYIAERRGVIFIERSLKQGLEFARHRNNTESLRAQVRRSITAFLLAQMNNGAFRSREPAKAFFVDVSDQLNTPSVIFAGQLIARVGLATNKPAEFIILRISQDTRALEAELASAGG